MKPISAIILLLLLATCSAGLPTYRVKFSGNTIQVPGSAFENSNIAIVRDDQAQYDILLIKRSTSVYDAFLLKCSNAEHPLTVTPTEIFCNEDGSKYNYEGTVTTGPAETPLIKFPAEMSDNLGNVNQGMITINIESLEL